MKTHSFQLPHSRLFAAVFAVSALLLAVSASSAMALTASDLAFTSTAPSGVTYGDKIAYNVTTSSSSTGTLTLSIDSGSSSVCKLTGSVVSVTGAGTCKIKADQTADATYDVGAVSQSFSVAKAALTVTASSASAFYGADLATITPAYSGFVNGDSSSKLKTKPTCASTSIPLSPAGTYPTTCKSAASDNYSFTYVDGTYRQLLAPLVIIPTATIKVGKTPKFKLSGFGWQGFDDEDGNDLTGKVKCFVSKSAKRKPGFYKLSCSIGSLKSADYAITIGPGLLTVKK
jgi:hypothetical protein